jgi:4-amino-4-deoxy-L-arabinose transferase-like glycosyltransferase
VPKYRGGSGDRGSRAGCYAAAALRIPALLYGLAFVVRALLMAQYPDPGYPDSFYYVDVARSLAAGHGLNVDFVWIFAEVGGRLPASPVLPIPSNAHWLPLASFIQAPFVAVLGPTAIASALPMVLIGSLAAPLTWAIARDVGASRTVQLGAGVLGAIPAIGVVFMAQPENFAIFQPLVAAVLWLAARGLRGDARAYVASGFLVGLASIARNDAYLLGVAVGLVFVIDRIRVWRSGGRPRLPWAAAAGCLGLFLIVVGPWWYRQLTLFGSISPTASSGTALWLTSYRQWNSITADTSFDAFMAQGLGAIVSSRLFGFVAAAANFAVIIASVVLMPFIVWGAWRRRASNDVLPWFLYVFIMFAGATLIFPLHVPGGAFIHSAVGMAPLAYILALEGVAALVMTIARRRTAWQPNVATPLFTWAIVGLVISTAALYAPVAHASWNADRAPRVTLAAELDRLGIPLTDRLMTIDAAGYKYFTGRPGVVSPDDPIDTIRAVAAGYGIRWMVIERAGTVEALYPVLADDRRPDWIGTAVYTIPSTDGGPPTLALYPVCLSRDDSRCQVVAAR